MARTKKTKSNSNDININIKLNKEIDLDAHTFSVLQKIKKKYGYSYKQLLCAITLFYEHNSQYSSEEFLLLNTGRSSINPDVFDSTTQSNDNIEPGKEAEQSIAKINPHQETDTNSVAAQNEEEKNDEPALTDEDVYDFLSQNGDMFDYSGDEE